MDQAKAILKTNDLGNHTIPAEGLYPHQWLWDSCFISIGMRHYDIDRAQTEILSLLSGQWANGMLPHLIFAKGEDHHRDREMWRSWTNPFAPDDVATSGITQPPVLAEAVLRIGEKLKLPERRSWYHRVYPALLAYHQWLYKERDPRGEGAVVQIHPWETGLDNTPPWMHELHLRRLPLWIRAIEKLHAEPLINIFRRDLHYVPPGQRLTTVDAMAFYSAQRGLKRKSYDIGKILPRSALAIEDLTFNCILIRANDNLHKIAATIGKELPDELKESMAKTKTVLEQFWDAYSGQYCSRSFVTRKIIKVPSIATLMPLYAGCVSKERAEQLVALLKNKHQFGAKYPVPSVPLTSEWFQPHTYWQGPAWINTNWLIIDGLKQYGYKEEAQQLTATTLELIEKSGFYEYFSPLDGSPAGTKNFSWTAALIIDLLKH